MQKSPHACLDRLRDEIGRTDDIGRENGIGITLPRVCAVRGHVEHHRRLLDPEHMPDTRAIKKVDLMQRNAIPYGVQAPTISSGTDKRSDRETLPQRIMNQRSADEARRAGDKDVRHRVRGWGAS